MCLASETAGALIDVSRATRRRSGESTCQRPTPGMELLLSLTWPTVTAMAYSVVAACGSLLAQFRVQCPARLDDVAFAVAVRAVLSTTAMW